MIPTRQAQIEAAEDAAIASIPRDLLDNLEKANAEFAAAGGCPGCKSLRIGVHKMPCSWCDENPDFY